MLARFAARRPVLWWLALAVIAYALFGILGLDYDQGPLGFVLLVAVVVCGWPFSFALGLSGMLFGWLPAPGAVVIGWGLGLLFFVASDRLLTNFVRTRTQGESGASAG